MEFRVLTTSVLSPKLEVLGRRLPTEKAAAGKLAMGELRRLSATEKPQVNPNDAFEGRDLTYPYKDNSKRMLF